MNIPLLHRPALFFLLALLAAPAMAACPAPTARTGKPAAQAQEQQGQQQESGEKETVRIGEREFEVPPQWQGLRIRETPPTQAELAAVPRGLAKNHGLIFLRRDARDALVAMAAEAEKAGIALEIDSGYRSSGYQKKIIARQLARGRSFARITRFVAPPGYSEHRTGTAVDFTPSNWRFASTPQYHWLAEHAAHFGFTETYPENDHRHPWEPWHWRYRPVDQPAPRAR